MITAVTAAVTVAYVFAGALAAGGDRRLRRRITDRRGPGRPQPRAGHRHRRPVRCGDRARRGHSQRGRRPPEPDPLTHATSCPHRARRDPGPGPCPGPTYGVRLAAVSQVIQTLSGRPSNGRGTGVRLSLSGDPVPAGADVDVRGGAGGLWFEARRSPRPRPGCGPGRCCTPPPGPAPPRPGRTWRTSLTGWWSHRTSPRPASTVTVNVTCAGQAQNVIPLPGLDTRGGAVLPGRHRTVHAMSRPVPVRRRPSRRPVRRRRPCRGSALPRPARRRWRWRSPPR